MRPPGQIKHTFKDILFMAKVFVEDLICDTISYIIYFWNTYLKVTINVNTMFLNLHFREQVK